VLLYIFIDRNLENYKLCLFSGISNRGYKSGFGREADFFLYIILDISHYLCRFFDLLVWANPRVQKEINCDQNVVMVKLEVSAASGRSNF
jgi:hypothetical protein